MSTFVAIGALRVNVGVIPCKTGRFLYTCIDSITTVTMALALNMVIMIIEIGHIVFLVLIFMRGSGKFCQMGSFF